MFATISSPDDQEKDNPDVVDGLLTQELLLLSVQERNDIQEEIHGVECLAPEENPWLLKESLWRLQQEINMMPAFRKQAYLKSQALVSENNDLPCTTYVNTDDFRLRFLRCELFDVRKAAARMTKFLDLILELFGEYALRRPIRLDDFSKMELRQFRKGRYQFLPYRDRANTCGRRVVCALPDEEWEAIPPYVRNKILIYMVWIAGNDVNTQKQGLVFVIWIDPSFKVSKTPPIHTKDHETLTVRASSIHMCSTNTPLFRFRRSIVTMRIGHLRQRLKQHVGEPIELRYALQSYGIPVDQIPITYTGKLKFTSFRHWLRSREFVECKQCEETKKSNVYGNTNNLDANDPITVSSSGSCYSNIADESNRNDISIADAVIESPYLNDIIFRKGANTSYHPGNAAMSRLISAKTKNELQAQHEQQLYGKIDIDDERKTKNNNSKRIKTKLFVSETIQEIREKNRIEAKMCRFLVWDERGWWTELSSEHEIYTRVEYIARGIRNTVTKNYRSSTSLLQSPIEPLPVGFSKYAVEEVSKVSSTGTSLEHHQLKGATNFQFPDIRGGLRRENKKTRLMSNSSDDEYGFMMANESDF